MICWSCERAAGDGALCSNCGAVLPPDAAMDCFNVLGVPRRYDLDLPAAEARFRELSRQFHPDRFAKADPRARRASLQRSVQLNEAWRTIKDPVRRAEYLLELAGYKLGEAGAPRSARNTDARSRDGGTRALVPVPPALLGEILELREELGEARAAGDDTRVQRMAAGTRQRIDAALARVAVALAPRLAGDDSPRTKEWEAASRALIEIRYFRRLLDEAEVHEEAVAARSEQASHG